LKSNTNLPGIVAMVTAAALFSLMDAGLKLLTPHYPAMQVTALRSLASLPLVYAYVLWRGNLAALLQVRWRLHLLRGALGIVMLAMFIFGLRHLALAEAYSIFFVAPLLITALSVPLLGERVDAARWIAIAVGLAGVLVVLRPTGTGLLTLGGLAVLASAVCYAISAIAIRIAGRTDSMASLMFWLITLLAAGSTALAWPHWLPIRTADAWVIVGIGITGFCGQFGVTYAFRHGEASAIAPFEYTALFWGLTMDRVVWHTTPDHYMLLGAAIIIGSGLYLVRRENVHAEAEHP
jgi:drug/metabolite transporter (DMT)-like permease